jgi:nucleotide-binding universal stress UspA family protein
MNVLISYDGSENADTAIAEAARLFSRLVLDAVVLTVREPLLVQALRAERFGGPISVPEDAGGEDERSSVTARHVAVDGTRLAADAGIDARPLWMADSRTIADAITEEADELDVDAIVMGSRGLTGIKATFGSVSTHVVQHSRRPVLVIPSLEAASGSTATQAAANEAR